MAPSTGGGNRRAQPDDPVSPAGRSSGPRGWTRLRRWSIVGILVAVIAVLLVAVVPVHVGWEVAEDPPAVLLGPHEIGPRVVPTTLEVEVSVAAGGGLRLAPPTVWTGSQVQDPDVRLGSGWDAGGERLLGRPDGEPLVVTAISRSLTLVLQADDEPASAEIRAGSSVERIDVPAGGDPTIVMVVSPVRRERATELFAYRSHTIPLPPGAEPSVSIGPLPVDADLLHQGDVLIVGPRAVLRTLAAAALAFVPVVLIAAVGLGAALVLGSAVHAAARCSVRGSATRLAVGLALPFCLLGALNYVLDGRTAALVVLAASTAFVLAVARTRGLGLDRTTGLGPAAWSAVAFGVLIVNLPAALTRSTNIGLLQTDIYDYFHLQRTFWRTSIIDAGTDWGDGLRTLDSTVRSVIQHSAGSSAWEAATVVRGLFSVVLLVAVAEAAAALGASARRVLLVTAFVAVLGPLHGLWLEGYLTRELFGVLLIVALACTVIVICDGSWVGAESRGSMIVLGVIVALPAALVPPYLVVLGGMACLFVLGRGDGVSVRERVVAAGWFAGALFVTVVGNLRWVLGFETADGYAQAVEGIGKEVVVPFHDSPRFPAALLGMVPFHMNEGSLRGGEAPEWLPAPLRAVHGWMDAAAGSWLVVAGAGLVLLAAMGVGIVGRGLRDPSTTYLFGCWATAVVGFLLVLPSWDEQSFFILMWAWTLVPVALVAMALVLARGVPVAAGRSLVAILAVLTAANLLTTTMGATRWFEDPGGPAAAGTHYDLAHDLLLLDDLDLGGAATFSVDVPSGDLVGTDDDRVLGNLVELVLVAEGLSCSNCIVDPRNTSIERFARPVPRSDLRVIVGGDVCGPGERRLLAGFAVVVCSVVGDPAP